MTDLPALTIRTGGQTGVDRAALDVAHRLRLPYAGWCPKGGWAEDRPAPPGVRLDYPKLTDTPSDRSQQRTAWNVRDADATLVLVPGDDLSPFGGTEFAYVMARLVFERPCLVADVRIPNDPFAARDWIARTAADLGRKQLVLNVAGPRETESRGVYTAAHRFLLAALGGG
jgi:hypothetical protein